MQAQFDQLAQDLGGLPTALLKSRAAEALNDWPPSVDRFGRELVPRSTNRKASFSVEVSNVRNAVRDVGRRLLSLGFIQLRKKPWMFVRNLRDCGVIFAGLGGTKSIPLCVSQSVSIWTQLHVPDEDLERFGDLVVNWLKERQVDVHEARVTSAIEADGFSVTSQLD